MAALDTLTALLPANEEATIFDILIMDKFSSTLFPGFVYMLRHVLLPSFPSLAGLVPMKLELYLGIAAQLQGRYLTTSGPSCPSC